MKEFSSGHVKKTVQVLQDLRLFWSKYFPSRPYEVFISLSVEEWQVILSKNRLILQHTIDATACSLAAAVLPAVRWMLVSLTLPSSQVLHHYTCVLSSLGTSSQESGKTGQLPSLQQSRGRTTLGFKGPHSEGLMSPSGHQWLLEQLQSALETEMKNYDRILLLQKIQV